MSGLGSADFFERLMTMAGICIISFDCEGKWGMAGHQNSEHGRLFTTNNLFNVYRDILTILDIADIKATFAFVGALTLDEEYFVTKWLGKLKNSQQHSIWLSKLISDLSSGNPKGWFLPELLRSVQSTKTKHEISSHGFTHIPLNNASKESLAIEMEGIKDWMQVHEISIDTFIYPRNLLTNTLELQKIGVIGYRDCPIGSSIGGAKGRLFSLAKEFYPFPSSQKSIKPIGNYPIAIPGDFFLNWRSGARKLVPFDLTLHRFRHSLAHAFKNNGIVHLWLHPHNLITGDRQKVLFKSCVEILKKEVDNEKIIVMTQSEYSKSLLISLNNNIAIYGSISDQQQLEGAFNEDS